MAAEDNNTSNNDPQLAQYIKTISEDESFLRTLLDTLPLAVFYRNCDGRFQGCNSAFENASGLTRSQMNNRLSEEIFSEENVPMFVRDDEKLRDQKLVEYQSVFFTASGDERDVIVRKAPFFSAAQERIGSIGCIYDITEQVRLQELLKNLSIKDDLTDLYNKRGFSELAAQAWTNALRNQHSVALLMIDIDYFKFYNDTYGHQKGDDCLVMVANVIKRNTKRHSDIVARFGGEEFVIMLPQTDFNGAHIVAKRIRNAIYNQNLIHEKGAVNSRVTVSVGIAVRNLMPGDEIDALIAKADSNLYLAKENGRNRVEGFRSGQNTAD